MSEVTKLGFRATLDRMVDHAYSKVYCPPGERPNTTGFFLFYHLAPVILAIAWPGVLLFRWWFR